ncbi:Short transient receptor potential channel 2-like protein, partial [Ophiophagus hannah]
MFTGERWKQSCVWMLSVDVLQPFSCLVCVVFPSFEGIKGASLVFFVTVYFVSHPGPSQCTNVPPVPDLMSPLIRTRFIFNETFQFLFWTMMGMEEHKVVDMPQFFMAELVGRVLYGVFTIVMVVAGRDWRGTRGAEYSDFHPLNSQQQFSVNLKEWNLFPLDASGASNLGHFKTCGLQIPEFPSQSGMIELEGTRKIT